MDKLQKQLLDTYLRKRTKANATGMVSQGFELYEAKHILDKNILIDLNSFDSYLIEELIIDYPEIISKIDINNLNTSFVVDLVSADPTLINKVDLRNWDYNSVYSLVFRRPELEYIKKKYFNIINSQNK